MKAAINIDITYNQVLSLVKRLPQNQKIRLSRELEKEGISSKLGMLLQAFKTDELSLDTIDQEVEQVREKIYAGKKKH